MLYIYFFENNSLLSFYFHLKRVHILNTESWVFIVGLNIFELAQSAAIHDSSFLPENCSSSC